MFHTEHIGFVESPRGDMVTVNKVGGAIRTSLALPGP